MSVSPETRVRRTTKAAWQDIEGETVLLVAAEDKLLGLNPAAARIWQMADGSRTPEEIAVELGRDFAAPPEGVLADTLAFVRMLVARGLLEVAP